MRGLECVQSDSHGENRESWHLGIFVVELMIGGVSDLNALECSVVFGGFGESVMFWLIGWVVQIAEFL
jgi:hypothetical protein